MEGSGRLTNVTKLPRLGWSTSDMRVKSVRLAQGNELSKCQAFFCFIKRLSRAALYIPVCSPRTADVTRALLRMVAALWRLGEDRRTTAWPCSLIDTLTRAHSKDEREAQSVLVWPFSTTCPHISARTLRSIGSTVGGNKFESNPKYQIQLSRVGR